MRYLALASDYDGTLARDGLMEEATVTALTRLRNSGRKLLMVTGRQLEDLFALKLTVITGAALIVCLLPQVAWWLTR